MEFVRLVLEDQPLTALFLTIALGYVVGQINLKGISLGVGAVLFVAFDLEEQGLVGSRRLAAAPPLPLDRCAAFLTMDQMGRSLADLVPGTLFVMGAEHAEVLDAVVSDQPAIPGGKLGKLGIDFQPRVGYSDYLPFLEREMPFLFVSTGLA